MDGSVLNRRHVMLEWDFSTEETRVELDNSSERDLFENPIFSQIIKGSNSILVEEGLAWGESYQWRIRDESISPPGPWLFLNTFSLKDLPEEINLTVNSFGKPSDGVTVFNFCNFLLGYGKNSELIWFVESEQNVTDIVQTKDGDYLYVSSGQAFKVDIDGNIIWSSPNSSDSRVHHAAIELDNGDILAMCRDRQDHVWQGESRSWLGDKIIRFDAETGQPIWSWTVFDHFSFEDVDEFAANPWDDWTHGNGLAYDEKENLIVASFRQISRLTAVDLGTGTLLWNIGFDLPSGDCPMGDNLFSFQHAPQILSNNRILVFDNGNRRDHQTWQPSDPKAYSRAIELVLDDLRSPTQVKEGWSYQFGYCPSMGDADRLENGTTLITATRLNSIYEIGLNGTLKKSWNVNQIANCGSLGDPAYASERLPAIQLQPEENQCIGDLDSSGFVNINDVLKLVSFLGTENTEIDLNNDNQVNIIDLLILISNLGACQN